MKTRCSRECQEMLAGSLNVNRYKASRSDRKPATTYAHFLLLLRFRTTVCVCACLFVSVFVYVCVYTCKGKHTVTMNARIFQNSVPYSRSGFLGSLRGRRPET